MNVQSANHSRESSGGRKRRGRSLVNNNKRQRGSSLVDDNKRQRGRSLVDDNNRRRGRPLVDDKRRIILDAALRVFAAKGYHGTTVPEVAEASGVGTGTLYRYFANKEALVNEVYRDAKVRLRSAVLDGVPEPDLAKRDGAHRWFSELWRRLGAFAKAEPEAFRFLEMQDHVEYLDPKSRQLELSVLMPLWMTGKRMLARGAAAPLTAPARRMMTSQTAPPTAPARRAAVTPTAPARRAAVTPTTPAGRSAAPADTLIALLWGAFVGLVKAARLGYLQLDDKCLAQAGEACWRMLAPDVSRTPRTKG